MEHHYAVPGASAEMNDKLEALHRSVPKPKAYNVLPTLLTNTALNVASPVAAWERHIGTLGVAQKRFSMVSKLRKARETSVCVCRLEKLA